jgi:hypothetical protein
MAYNNGPKIITNGLVLTLDAANTKSYPGSGTMWNDLSGNGNTGTLTNGPTFDGSNGGSIVFDGVNDYVDCGSASSVQLSNNFTLSVWHKNINTGYIIDQGNIGEDPTGCLEFTNRGLRLSLNNIETVTANGTFSNTTVWNHIDCTFASGIVTFYINGVFDSTKITTSTAFSPSGTLKIGRRALNTSSILTGNISIVKIYNRVLTAQEVLQNFNATRSRFGV